MSPACETCIALVVLSGAVAQAYLTRRLTPRMATSICPPRIIANDSLVSANILFNDLPVIKALRLHSPNTDAPGNNVTASFPALITSLRRPNQRMQNDLRDRPYASSCSLVGYGPIPRIPFSLCSHTFTPVGRCSGTSVGMPIPRFTWKPFLSSFAARRAILWRISKTGGLCPPWLSDAG